MKQRMYVDERQERELLWIEHRSFWLVFWCLIISIVVQAVWLGPRLEVLGGELVALAAGSVAIIWGCVRKGVWTFRGQKPSAKMSLLTALIAAVLGTLLIRFTWPLEVSGPWFYAGAAAAIFAVTFGILALMGYMVKRKESKMAEALEAEE